jgi:hypothetical protein
MRRSYGRPGHHLGIISAGSLRLQLGATRTLGTAAPARSNCSSAVDIAALGPLALACSMLSAADQ